jgi:hypothetical protein
VIITFILAFFGGIIGAGAGYAAAAALALILTGGISAPDFEGGRAMFAAFTAGPIGAIVGFVFGVWLGLRLRGQHSFIAVLGYSAFSIIAISVLGAAVAGGIYFYNAPLYGDRSRFALEFEIKLPPNAKLPMRMGNIGIEMQADTNRISAQFDFTETHKDGERTVLVGDVELYHRASSRTLVLFMPDEPHREFRLPLAANPAIFEEFTPWARVDLIDDPPEHPRKAGPEAADDYEIRYRLPDPRKPVPHIEFEVRLPTGTRLGDSFLPFHTAQRRDDGEDWGYYLHENNWQRFDGDQPVLMGGMAISKPSKHPKLALKLLDGPLRVFDLDFPAAPAPTPDFGPWKAAVALEEFGQPPRPPGPDDPSFELRYRIDAPRPFRN